MFGFLNWLLTWWNGTTVGTWWTTRLHGVFVGEDAQGNRYYRNRQDTRRWVIYAGMAEASKIPAEWHGWLHYTYDSPPTEDPPAVKPWEQPHQPNLTGTPDAYRPKGSLYGEGRRAPATGDYDAWQPE